jgi:quinol monooxygenase YgiN
MILVIIRMRVLAEKRKELSHAIASLVGSIRTQRGCPALRLLPEFGG